MSVDEDSHFYSLSGLLDILGNNNAVFPALQKCLICPLKLMLCKMSDESSLP